MFSPKELLSSGYPLEDLDSLPLQKQRLIRKSLFTKYNLEKIRVGWLPTEILGYFGGPVLRTAWYQMVNFSDVMDVDWMGF